MKQSTVDWGNEEVKVAGGGVWLCWC